MDGLPIETWLVCCRCYFFWILKPIGPWHCEGVRRGKELDGRKGMVNIIVDTFCMDGKHDVWCPECKQELIMLGRHATARRR